MWPRGGCTVGHPSVRRKIVDSRCLEAEAIGVALVVDRGALLFDEEGVGAGELLFPAKVFDTFWKMDGDPGSTGGGFSMGEEGAIFDTDTVFSSVKIFIPTLRPSHKFVPPLG